MAAADPDVDRAQFDIQRQYAEFLEDNTTEASGLKSNYDLIKEMIQKKNTRVVVSINDLRKKNLERCIRLLENGFEEIPLFNKALREVVTSIDQDFAKEKEEFYIGLEGSFGAKHVTPRTLTSRFLGNTVCVEGIVTKCSGVCPKVVRSVHYCPATKKTIERRYADVTSFDLIPTANVYPTKDDDGNLLETEYGLSKYRDHQTVTLQEMPERAPTGQLPRSVDLVLDNDLVDKCKPGDRVLIVAVYRCLPGKQGGMTSGVFKSILLGVHIQSLSKDANLTITHDDVKECKRFSRTANPFESLARSMAPSIHGHDYIKKAILCLLLGGVEKILPNGTRLRGDINVLLIGDPSVAKSQILRYVSNVAPRVIMTTGRGSSGVGLTAAVTTDFDSGERRLEAGAMVLADRGVVCIDEFDKMSDADRTAIHEVMEQGRVTISKAGIHARLNARTSVLAAANPIMGRYDETKSPMDNIAMQDSLLSRFDLLFIVKDKIEKEHDRMVGDHVLRMNRYRAPNEQDGGATPLFQTDMIFSTRLEIENEDHHKTKVYEKHNPLIHGRTRGTKTLSMDFIKKYIHVARLVKPKLTDETSKLIADEYTRLRSHEFTDKLQKTEPITPRTLETLIRLSTAHARSRMSKFIEKKDTMAAIELVTYALFEEVQEKKKKKRRADDGEDSELSEAEEEEGDQERMEFDAESGGEGEGVSSQSQRKKAKRQKLEDSEMTEEGEGVGQKVLADTMDIDQGEGSSVIMVQPLEIERLNLFKSRMALLFDNERAESLSKDVVDEWMLKEGFTNEEILAGITALCEGGFIMTSDNFIFLI